MHRRVAWYHRRRKELIALLFCLVLMKRSRAKINADLSRIRNGRVSKRKQRSFWNIRMNPNVKRPFFSSRQTRPANANLGKEITLPVNQDELQRLQHEAKIQKEIFFLDCFNMTPVMFEEFLKDIAPLITKKVTNMKSPIPAAKRLAITLRFLVKGENYTSLANAYQTNKSSVSQMVPETCKAIWTVLCKTHMVLPDQDGWSKIALDFEDKWNFPKCVGSVINRQLNFTKKATQNILFTAAVDANYQFITVICEDATKIEEINLGICENSEDSDSDDLPFVFLGDSFPLNMQNLIQPYDCQLNPVQQLYNLRLRKAHQTAENALGLMTLNFKVLQQYFMQFPWHAEMIIKACAVLHNYLAENKESYIREELIDHDDDDGVSQDGLWRYSLPSKNLGLLPITSKNEDKFPNVTTVVSPHTAHFAQYFANECNDFANQPSVLEDD